MEPEELLAFAELLGSSNTPPAEATLRSAFSRLYYASYHVVLKTLRMEGLDPRETLENQRNGRGFSNHTLVQRWLGSSKDDNIYKLRDILSELYALRQRSDYELMNLESITKENFKIMLQLAKKTIFKTMQIFQQDTQKRGAWGTDIYDYEQRSAQHLKERP